jgi:hypothetical protein
MACEVMKIREISSNCCANDCTHRKARIRLFDASALPEHATTLLPFDRIALFSSAQEIYVSFPFSREWRTIERSKGSFTLYAMKRQVHASVDCLSAL